MASALSFVPGTSVVRSISDTGENLSKIRSEIEVGHVRLINKFLMDRVMS